MSGATSWQFVGEDGVERVMLRGEITEASELDALLGRLEGTVVLDLSGIKRINSRGVREWVEFVRAAKAKGADLILEACSVPFVQQLNLMTAFRGHSVVRSVHAPYFCPRCNTEHTALVEVTGPQPRVEASLPCPTCGAAMELDDLPDRYLSFCAAR